MCDQSSAGLFMGPQAAGVRGRPAASALLASAPLELKSDAEEAAEILSHRTGSTIHDRATRGPGRQAWGRRRAAASATSARLTPCCQQKLHGCSCLQPLRPADHEMSNILPFQLACDHKLMSAAAGWQHLLASQLASRCTACRCTLRYRCWHCTVEAATPGRTRPTGTRR